MSRPFGQLIIVGNICITLAFLVHGGRMRAGAVNTWFCCGLVKSIISTRTMTLYRFKVMNFKRL